MKDIYQMIFQMKAKMRQMIDIHTHILPNIDDGSKSIDESVMMLEKEIKDGINTVVLTPHFRNNKELIIKRFNEFIKNINLDINLLLGSEIHYEKNTLDLLKRDELLTINNTKYLLIEFSPYEDKNTIKKTLYNICVNGYHPIFAHAERCALDIKDYEEIKRDGTLIQVNVSSLKIKLVKKLIKNNLVDFIASDCHSVNERMPNMDKAKKVLKKYKNINSIEFK